MDGKNDAAMFLPLTVKGGSLISSKCEDNDKKFSKLPKYQLATFITEDNVKTKSNKANTRHEIHSHIIQKGIKD